MLLLKNLSVKQPSVFPFTTMCDFGLLQNDEFETLCKKISNGTIKVQKQVGGHLFVSTSAIKPGSRFTDETGVIGITEQFGVRLLGNQTEAMSKFQAKDKVAEATKEMKTTFKIEIEEEEKANRDKHAQSIYHTGKLIQIEEEDRQQLQAHELEKIAEEGMRESSDEGDGDDPDADLDF